MYTFILFCAAISTGTSAAITRIQLKLPHEVTVIMEAAAIQCMNETGITVNAIEMTRQGKYKEDDLYKRHVHCTYQKSGYARPDGHIIVDKAAELFPEDIDILPVLKKCDIQGKDEVETTFLSFKCFQDTSPLLLRV